MLLLLTKTSFSQTLSITETQRDSIYAKIIRGNEAIENNKVLTVQLVKRDSVIAIQKEIIDFKTTNLQLQQSISSNLKMVIANKEKEIHNEITRGKRNKRNAFFKGGILGAGATILGIILIK